MPYVDGYVLPIPKKHLALYRRVAQKAGRIWREHGALEYRECVGEDLNVKGVVTFPRQMACARGETVVFAWIVFKSRAHRDRVNKKVLTDPRITALGNPFPFSMKRMVYGGFQTIVDYPPDLARRSASR
jgi:uncharacterized protein YbaA (DUF1428 family)